jgi:hypothetical protein
MSHYVIPESTTEVFYPVSKRKKIVNHKGDVVYDSAKAKVTVTNTNTYTNTTKATSGTRSKVD